MEEEKGRRVRKERRNGALTLSDVDVAENDDEDPNGKPGDRCGVSRGQRRRKEEDG